LINIADPANLSRYKSRNMSILSITHPGRSLLLTLLLAGAGSVAALAAPGGDEDLVPEPQTEPVDSSSETMPRENAAVNDTALTKAMLATNVLPRTFEMLGEQVPPGAADRLSWSATELFEGVPVTTPVLVVNGSVSGPTLCLTAAIHGDELNGIEIVRRVMHNLDPSKLSGTVIGVPIVNLQGFRRGSRYLPDRRDLNRYFPGNPKGSAASRIAYSFFSDVISHCNALVDLHTGSFERANLPQLRADLRNADIVKLTAGFGATVIVHSQPTSGTLRFAATVAGIPTVTLEAGGPLELEIDEVKHGVKGVETLLNTLGMVKKIRLWGESEPVYYRSSWVRANSGGILLADVTLGTVVRRGDLLGTITDPMTNASSKIYSQHAGRIIGMAKNQIVMPGFAAFHVGIQTAEAPTGDSDDDNVTHEDSRDAEPDDNISE
jgi:predicted deacylase